VVGRTTDLQLILDRKTGLEGRAEVRLWDWEMIGSRMEVTWEDLVLLQEISERKVALGVILDWMVV
jgi:hypothetical protein